MSDGVKSEISSDIEQNYSLNTADPKNVQELTIYVSMQPIWSIGIQSSKQFDVNFYVYCNAIDN